MSERAVNDLKFLISVGSSGADNQVQVIFENDVAEDQQSTLLLKVSPGVVDEIDRFGARENGEPADDRAREEIRILGFEDPIAAARHAAHNDSKRELRERGE
jgi:hypothetical protein